MIDAVRSGAWLTRERMTVYPLLLGGALAVALAALIVGSHAGLDPWGRPLGTDFSQMWVAGLEIAAGHPAQVYDNVAHAAAQQVAFGHSDSFYTWPYPPYFLAVARLAATMPYLAALALWQGSTLALYLLLLRRMVPADLPPALWIGPALAFPAVAINLMHGHNGFLTAALLGFGLLCLRERPLLAGVLFGLLAYKPQFALALPVALLAGGHVRAILATLATVFVATLATVMAFGLDTWRAFVASTGFTRHVVLEQGAPGFGKMQSAFAAVRLVGGDVALAYVAQGVVTLAVLGALAWLWQGRADTRLKVAGVCVATLLTTPYCMDYDMVVLAPVIAALVGYGVEDGFASWGRSLLALTWAMPLLARVFATGFAVPVGFPVMAVLFGHVIALARRSAEATRGPGVVAKKSRNSSGRPHASL